mgnify:CR=1 FL=1
MTSGPFALELSSVTKSFGAVRALSGARLGVKAGEIHALLGENGAGKSTLVSIAAGLLRPDGGQVRRSGTPVSFPDPRAARHAGVALVPQHDLLVDAATVADNLALLDPLAPTFESARARRARVDRLARTSDLDLGSPDARVEDLPVGTRQRIGIAGALQTDPDVLILDEPTAVLSPDETAALFRALRRRVEGGRAVVLITHRLAEVFEGADRLTLLSRGRTLLEASVSATTPGAVAALLLGGAEITARPAPLSRSEHHAGAPSALSLGEFRPSGSPAPPVSLSLEPEEALTLLAIDGNGAVRVGDEGIDVDLQDVGARLYTYIWTVKLCMEACAEAGIPLWILDRPNPIGRVRPDGPVLREEYFTFVGGASIPLCHRMTIGEMAVWIRGKHIPECELHVIRAEGWGRNLLYHETGLPWVLPSPNMPTPETALVYPGMVLAEALNLSEGRGTVIPFELTGAPFISSHRLLSELRSRQIPGCSFRIHDFIPTFHKFAGEYCRGIQVHVTDASSFRPVATALHLFDAIIKTSPAGSLTFNPPPYEYEYRLMPFDILSGDSRMREVLEKGLSLSDEIARWDASIEEFSAEFRHLALYDE